MSFPSTLDKRYVYSVGLRRWIIDWEGYGVGRAAAWRRIEDGDAGGPGNIAAYGDGETLYQVEGLLLAPPEPRQGRADLLLADSGYAPSNPAEWIEKLKPQVALLSVAAGEREWRPDAEALETMKGYNLLRTDRNGWIEMPPKSIDKLRGQIRWQQQIVYLPV